MADKEKSPAKGKPKSAGGASKGRMKVPASETPPPLAVPQPEHEVLPEVDEKPSQPSPSESGVANTGSSNKAEQVSPVRGKAKGGAPPSRGKKAAAAAASKSPAEEGLVIPSVSAGDSNASYDEAKELLAMGADCDDDDNTASQSNPAKKQGHGQQGGDKEASEAPPSKAGAAGGQKSKEINKERVLRDDEECFVADYTGVNEQPKTPKFELFDKVRRARIARELVEMDPEVELRIRTHPSKEAEEIRVLTADDTVEVVGTCGEWLRLAGNDEQWIKYMQSENEDIPEQLVDILGPSILSVASSLTSGWFSSANPTSQDAESVDTGGKEKKRDEPEPAAAASGGGGGGWGFGGWGAAAAAKSLFSNVLSAGADGTEAAGAVVPTGGGGGEGSLSDTLRTAKAESGKVVGEIGDDITESVARQFDKEMQLDEGGLASVRAASKAISMLEGSMGWLGKTATTAAVSVQEKAKSVKDTVTSEEFVDKAIDTAWGAAKSGVQVGGSVVASATGMATTATEMAKSTTSAVVNSDAVNKVTAIGKSAMTTVGSNARTVITSAKSTLLGEDEVDEASVFPNRALGGVIAIELSGCIIERDPHVDDEDEDPFMSDGYSSTPMMAGAIEAVNALVRERFQDRVYLMCVAAPQVQARMLRWLSSHDFYNKTGTSREKVHFCRELDEKADVCKELGVTVLVESTASSVGLLDSVVETALLFGEGSDILQGNTANGGDRLQAQLWWDSVCAVLLPRQAAGIAAGAAAAGTQYTCFTSTKVQILTQFCEQGRGGNEGGQVVGGGEGGEDRKAGLEQVHEQQQGDKSGEEEERFFSGDEGEDKS